MAHPVDTDPVSLPSLERLQQARASAPASQEEFPPTMPTLRERLAAFRLVVEREGRFIFGTFAASGIGYLGSAGAPFIVSALIEAGFSHQQAGDLGTIELTTLALSSMLVTPLVTHVSHRKLAIGGVAIALTGLVISALSSAYFPMVIGRVIIGTGSGLAISGANAAVAAREDAERIFAIIWTMGGAVTASLALIMPRLVAGGNYPMGFSVLLVLSLVAAPLMIWVPTRPAAYGGEADVSADTTTVGGARGRRAGAVGVSALLVLASMFIYAVAEQAIWQFSFELTVDAGIPEAHTSVILFFTTFMGLAGGAFAAWLGLRMGRVFPFVAGFLCSATGQSIWIAASDTGLLWAGGMLWGFGFYFVSPYQMGLAAAIDRRGRVAVLAGGLLNLGYGFGPTLGGRLRQYQLDQGLDRTILIVGVAGMTLLAMLLCLVVSTRLERRSRVATAAQQVAGPEGSPAAELTDEGSSR
jgi:MFS family permease